MPKPVGLSFVFHFLETGMANISLSSKLYYWKNMPNGHTVGPQLRDGDKQRSEVGTGMPGLTGISSFIQANYFHREMLA